MTVTEKAPPAGWYSDPEGTPRLRYWNGEQWTSDFHVPVAQHAAAPQPAAKPPGDAPKGSGGTPPPTAPGRVRAHFQRHPLVWLAAAAALALMLGLGIGLAAQQPTLDDERAKSRDLGDQLTDARSKLNASESKLKAADARIAKLTAKGEVPSFVGGTVDDAEAIAADYDWVVKTRTQPSDRPRGEVISQFPVEGRTLRRGRSITLVTAVPRPKAWRTVRSFSGSGSERTDEFTIPSGKVRLKYSFSGDTNAILTLHSPGDDEFGGDLLLNEIGDRSGQTRLYDAEGEHYLEIQGGSWSVEVQAFR